jgi:hypothetical protein
LVSHERPLDEYVSRVFDPAANLGLVTLALECGGPIWIDEQNRTCFVARRARNQRDGARSPVAAALTAVH